LRAAFEEWLVIALREDDTLPELAGVSLNFGGKRWQHPLPAENQSEGSEDWTSKAPCPEVGISTCAGADSESFFPIHMVETSTYLCYAVY
jgi:hypothetical protein